MAAYDPNTREQVMKLKDGRTIFRTHNGFKSFVISQSGEITGITEAYYLKAKRLKIK